jgi:hypothetical protein
LVRIDVQARLKSLARKTVLRPHSQAPGRLRPPAAAAPSIAPYAECTAHLKDILFFLGIFFIQLVVVAIVVLLFGFLIYYFGLV